MKTNDQFVNGIIFRVLILLLIESIILLLGFDNFAPLFFSLLLGGFLSIIFFKIMYINIQYAITKSESGAKRFMAINYMIRYIISGLVLFVCARSPYLNVFACMIGLLSIKFTLYIDNFRSFFEKKKGRKDGY